MRTYKFTEFFIGGNVAKSIVIFFILMFAFASMAKAQEKVGYAVLTDNGDLEGKGKTLTFESGDAVPSWAMELNIFYRAPWSSQCANITNIVFEPSFKECYPSTLLGWFDDMENLTNITGMKDYLNTDDITDMGSRFYNCQKLSELDLSGFKTSNVTNMDGMFDWCLNLTNIKFGDNFNTGRVQQMNWMFYKCEKLTTLDLRGFDTKNVTDMSDMFGECTNLTAILVGDNWSTDQVTLSEGMFTNCSSLIGNGGQWVTSTDAINANTSSTGYLTKDNYKVFLELDGGTLEDGTVINLIDDETTLPIPTKQGAAFLGWQRQLTASTYESTVQIEVKVKKNEGNKKYKAQWGVGYAELSNNENGKTLTFKSGGTIPDGAMALNTGEESPAWNSLDKSEITQVAFDETFQYARPTSCYQWFSGFVRLSDIKNIQYLHTDDVTTMKYMFYSCERLKKLDLRTFNTENVEDMDNLFNQCYELTVLDLRSFNTQKAKTALWSNHNHLEYMFNNCKKLTTILIGNDWDAGENNYNSDMFLYNYELIGNDGTLYDLTDGNRSAEYANADAGGYLTKDNYKIFYLWADDDIPTYHTHTPSSFDGNSAVTLDKPEREGYELQYWERVSPKGDVIGGSSSSVTIAAGDVGNRIYKAHWTITKHAVNFYNGSEFLSSVEVNYGSPLASDQYAKPQKEGYYLLKWTLNADDPDKLGYGSEPIEEDINLYAQWKKDYFLVALPEHLEFIPKTDSPTEHFEFGSKLQFKVSDGYKATKVYYKENGKEIIIEPTNGVYTYDVPAKLTEIYADVKMTCTVSFKVAADLEYNGTKQNLITLESTSPSEITIQYKVDDGEYATTLPVATDAKDYVVWYKVDETEKYAAITETSLSVTISPKPLTITAESQSKIFGEDDPQLTYNVDGLLSSDKLTGSLTRDKGEDVGKYDITQGTLSASNNYKVTFNGAQLSILSQQAAALTDEQKPTANTLAYNGKNQSLVAAPIALPDGYNILYKLSSQSNYFEAIPNAKDAGNYIVSVYYQGDDNHESFEGADIDVSIKKAQLSITANSLTIDYAASIPNFTATYSGFVDNENESVLSGTLSFDCKYNPSAGAGKYDIIPKGLSSNNYDITFVKGVLTVKSEFEIEIEKESVVQEEIDPELFCVDGDGTVKLKFKTISGNITGYRLTVENNVVEPQSGTIDAGDSRINVTIPSDIKPGYYPGQIVFTDGNKESEQYNFTLKINMVKGVIKLLYRNVMFVDNHDTLFSEYQWVKNDIDIPNARKQYYTEPEFAGSYKCKMKTRVGIDVLACPFEQNITAKSLKANVVVYPNPAMANQRFTLQIRNYNPDNKYEIYITNSTGNIVKSITNAKQTNTIVLPLGHYIGALICNGEKSGFKVLVE